LYALDDPTQFRQRLRSVAREAFPTDRRCRLEKESRLPGAGDSVSFGGDLSESERLKLSLLLPHIKRAYARTRRAEELRRVSAVAAEALAATGKGVIALDEQGRVVVWTETAKVLVARYFGRAHAGGEQLPKPLAQWLHESEITGPRSPSRRPYVTERPGGRLTVSWLVSPVASQRLLLMEESLAGASARVLEKRLGLTARRAEVLLWVTFGKTSPEIATILGLSVGTISKHMEHILAQLGVTTRTAAALQAMEALYK
jgi:DNA-binding CsgD family transcriptional regulator